MGTLNMIKELEAGNRPSPKFEMLQSYFETNFIRQITPLITPLIDADKNLTELELKILNIIRGNEKITRKEISKELNISFYTVKEYINKLKQKNVITRFGTKEG